MTVGAAAEAFGLRLRPVAVADASFILGLRRTPALARFIGHTPDDVHAQEDWIRQQRDRPDDYYYLCETSGGTPLGTVGVYGRQGQRAEWGRWVLAEGSAAAVGCALLVYRLGLDELGLECLYSNTLATNTRVVSFHDSVGARRVTMPEGERSVMLHGRAEQVVRHEVDTTAWPPVRRRLEPIAAAARAFLS